MPNYDSGRAADIGGLNIRNRRGSDLTGIRFNDNRNAPTSANDMVLYRRSGGLYFWNGTTEYNLLTGISGGVGDMNAVYDGGHTISVDDGAVVWNDATAAAANLMEFNKTGAGSGNILDFDFTAAFTGNVLNLDFGSAIAAVGIALDSEGGARTGTDILVTDDSTGAHIVLDINKSGAGATTGFDYQESYNGSSASFALRVTLDNTDGLDTTALQIVRGTGVRTVPAIDINEGSTGSANVIDIDVSAAYTGNILDIVTSAAATGNAIFINLDSAVAATAIHLEGSGVRTQPMFEMHSDATGAVSLFEVLLTGATSGHVMEISMDTTSTGDVFNVDMNASVGGRFLFLDGGNAIRTANLVDVTNDGSGNTDVAEIADSNTGSGHVFDINVSGIGSGNVLDITYSAADTGNALNVVMADNVAGAALNITGAGARTDSIIEVVSSETGSVDGMLRAVASGVFTGHVLSLASSGAATTAGLLHLDLDAGVAYKAITIDHAGAREVETILVTFDGTFASGAGGTFLNLDVTMTGAAASPLLDLDITGLYTGNILDIGFSSAASTGDAVVVSMGTNVAGSAVVLSAAGARTDDLIKIDDSSTGNSHIFDINMTGVYTGNIFDVSFSAAATGDVFVVDMTNSVAGSALVLTGAGARTDDLIKIDDTGSGNSHIFDINFSGIYTGNCLDITYGTAAATGHALHVDMGTNLAGNAFLLDAAGERTAPLIYVANTGTDGGTDDHVLFINQTGLLDSNLVQLTFGTAASTGEALSIAMGTNVAGRAVYVSSAATGASGEGAAFDVEHTGDLVAGADLVTLHSTGNISSTSNILAIEQDTGAGTSGAYGLYINCTGTNVEAIKVDAGGVVFDESLSVGTTLTVTGACTFSSTILYRDLTEVVTSANTILAAESGSVFFLNSGTEFASELPAVAAGLHFTFIVTAAPSGANYTITTASSANVIKGTVHESSGGDGDSETTGADTINFVDGVSVAGDTVIVWCDGTNWFAKCFCDAAGGITITTAS